MQTALVIMMLQGLLGADEGHGTGTHQGADLVLVVPVHQALGRLGPGFLAGLGDVPGHEHPPVLPVDRLARLGGGLFGEAPLGGQGRQARLGVGADGQDAHAVFASQGHA